ncbi:MAG: RNA 2'-phosphotransferase [Saprospiraceae bacterium]
MKNENKNYKLGKFLSYILRHQPQKINIQLDKQGWTSIPTLLKQMNAHGKKIDRQTLDQIVADNDKKRYSIDFEKDLIRANQGHSVPIDLGYQPKEPPQFLYHGTADRFLNSILKEGLIKRNRHHVHLSLNIETATAVGKRHGKVIILKILAKLMHEDGYEFFLSDNNVWLTDHVPTNYIKS